MTNAQAIYAFICTGKRLEIPSDCAVSEIISSCWVDDPDKRPQFSEIVKRLELLQSKLL